VWKTYIIDSNRKKEIYSNSLWRHGHLGEQVPIVSAFPTPNNILPKNKLVLICLRVNRENTIQTAEALGRSHSP